MKKTNKAAQLNIRYASNDGQKLIVPVGERDLTVGSTETTDIHINSNTISRLHARIALRDSRVYVTDLNSRNGTFINGKRLQPNVEYEWLPGDHLLLSETPLELEQQAFQQELVHSDLKLVATPSLVKPGQTVRLTLSTRGESQQVTLQSQSIGSGLTVQLNWQGGELKPDIPLEIQAQIRTTKIFLTGGERRVRFVAISQSNLISTVEVTVHLRKRLETLLLLLFVLTGCSAASLAAIVVLPQIIKALNPPVNTPAIIDSPVPPKTAVVIAPTVTEVSPSLIVPTKAPTATDAPIIPTVITPTITPTVYVPTLCPPGTTLTHTVRAGETLFSIGLLYNTNVDALMINNNISDRNKIFTGQLLTVHCGEHRIIPTTEAPPICESVRPTSPLDGLNCGPNTFYWDPATGADHYQFNLYDEKDQQVRSLSTNGNETSLTTVIDAASAGGGLSFTWDVQALQNGQPICSSPRVTIPRSPCPLPRPEKPDLIVSNIKLVADPNWVKQCTVLSINVVYTITNIGKGSSGSFFSNVSYRVQGEEVDAQCGGVRSKGCPESSLNPGESVTISDQSLISVQVLGETSAITAIASADIGVPGQVCTNPNYCRVDETNEGNNFSSPLDFTVPNCLQTDLGIAINQGNETCTGNNNELFQLTYSYTVVNDGPTDANAITIVEDPQLTLESDLPIDPSAGVKNSDMFQIAVDKSIVITKTLTVGLPGTGSDGGLIRNFTAVFHLEVTVKTDNPTDTNSANNFLKFDSSLPSTRVQNCVPPILG